MSAGAQLLLVTSDIALSTQARRTSARLRAVIMERADANGGAGTGTPARQGKMMLRVFGGATASVLPMALSAAVDRRSGEALIGCRAYDTLWLSAEASSTTAMVDTVAVIATPQAEAGCIPGEVGGFLLTRRRASLTRCGATAWCA